MVPHHLHETYAVQCLEAGKHVLLEKPLAHTLDSCRRLLGAADDSDCVFMVGENSTHWPEVESFNAPQCLVPPWIADCHCSAGVQDEGAD